MNHQNNTVALIFAAWLIGNFIIIPVVMALGLKYTRWREAKRRAKRKFPQVAPPPAHPRCRCNVKPLVSNKPTHINIDTLVGSVHISSTTDHKQMEEEINKTLLRVLNNGISN